MADPRGFRAVPRPIRPQQARRAAARTWGPWPPRGTNPGPVDAPRNRVLRMATDSISLRIPCTLFFNCINCLPSDAATSGRRSPYKQHAKNCKHRTPGYPRNRRKPTARPSRPPILSLSSLEAGRRVSWVPQRSSSRHRRWRAFQPLFEFGHALSERPHHRRKTITEKEQGNYGHHDQSIGRQ